MTKNRLILSFLLSVLLQFNNPVISNPMSNQKSQAKLLNYYFIKKGESFFLDKSRRKQENIKEAKITCRSAKGVCPICRSRMFNKTHCSKTLLFVTRCNHVFCAECMEMLETIFETQNEITTYLTCPVCRSAHYR